MMSSPLRRYLRVLLRFGPLFAEPAQNQRLTPRNSRGGVGHKRPPAHSSEPTPASEGCAFQACEPVERRSESLPVESVEVVYRYDNVAGAAAWSVRRGA